MLILSPSVAAIVSNIQNSTKSDAGPDDQSFLTLLDSGRSNFYAGAESEQALVETLYKKDEQPAAVAAPVPVVVYDDRDVKLSSYEDDDKRNDSAPAPAVENSARVNQPSEKVPASNAAPAPKNDNNAKNDSVKPTSDAPAAAAKPAERTTQPAGAAENDSPVEQLSLTDQIRAKIENLSDILSAVAALLGGNVAGQVTVTKITQTTLTVTQQSQLTGQPLIDVSSQLDRLIAAAAGQNLPSQFGQSLSATFVSFQQLIVSFSGNNTSLADSSTLLAGCASCETDLAASLQNISLAQGDKIDIGQLNGQLQQLQKWLGDFRSLVAQGGNIVPSSDDATQITPQAATPAVTAQTSIITNTSLVQKPLAPVVKQTDDNAVLSIAAPSAAPATSAVVQNVPTVNNAAVGLVENATIAEANLSGGNSGAGGQGGERPATAPVTSFSGIGSASGSSEVGTSSFTKVLKATASAPVVDQVVFNIKTAVKDGASKIQIQLDPVELGKLHIKIDLGSDGKATGVVVTADNKSTLDLLQRDARGLEQALADAGIKADSGSLSFNLRGGDGGRDDAPKTPYAGYVQPSEEEALAPLAVISRSYVVNVADGLNIQI
ncbi:MAG: flagellar hook-length control protein FliK [Alphaproteobacteria bacterium]|nr:flagellar hook-length control protein FliK [Alphaproteobacteria bacterium]